MPKLHKTKTFKKGLKGGFKPGFTGSKPSGKIKKAAKDIKRKVDSKVSEVKKDVKSKVNKAKDKVNEIKTKREVKKNPPKKEKVYNPSTYSQSGTGDMDSRTSELSDMLSGASMKKFPEIKEKNKDKFTKWVENNMSGMDTCKAASKIIKSRTKKYSPAVIKMANYANNFGCKTKSKDGASVGGASMKGKRKALKELDKKSGQKVKTDKKGNVKKLTMTRRPGELNEEKVTYKGGHVNAKSKTSYTKSRKNTVAKRTIDGSLSYGNQEGGKKGKTVVKGLSGKTVYKTNNV